MKSLIILLTVIFSSLSFSAMNNTLTVQGMIKSFDDKMVVVKTSSGDVKVPRHFFTKQQIKDKKVKVVTTLTAILASN